MLLTTAHTGNCRVTVGARSTSIILNTMLLLVLTCPTGAVLTNEGTGKCPHIVKQKKVISLHCDMLYDKEVWTAAFSASCYFHWAMNSLVRSVLSVPGFVMLCVRRFSYLYCMDLCAAPGLKGEVGLDGPVLT